MIELLAGNLERVATHLCELGWINADETLTALESAGAGNMNRTLRARTATRSLILKQSVPFVAKYPDIPAPVGRIAVEIAFYRAVRASPALSARLPCVIGYDADNHLMALEDLGDATDFTDVYHHEDRTPTASPRLDLTPRHAAALLDWIGALHGLRIDIDAFPELENRAMRALNHAHIFDIPLRTDNGLDLDAITPGLAAFARELTADTALRGTVAALGEIYLGRASHASAPTLLHGDYFPGSWLRDAQTDVKIIDPEFGFIGPPEFDIGVLIAHLTFAGFGPAELATKLRRYVAPERFSIALAYAFGGVEIIRRLLGVAQLPVREDLTSKQAWLTTARHWIGSL
jgi:5-methylthioribose kinase